MQINIDMPKDAHDISSCNKMNRHGFALFGLGFLSFFRSFFLLAGVYALVTILVWGGVYVYVYGWPALNLPFTTMHWHAHEIIFGYGMAVAAGFLFAAVRNWTHIDTLQGCPLAGLAALWLAIAQALWVLAFFLFVWVYAPILVKSRVDGLPG